MLKQNFNKCENKFYTVKVNVYLCFMKSMRQRKFDIRVAAFVVLIVVLTINAFIIWLAYVVGGWWLAVPFILVGLLILFAYPYHKIYN